jgi:glycosyltransferase involved in cell wall biosynthesis
MGAPWPMLKETGCGWWVQPTVEGIVDGLLQATSLDSETLQRMGENGRSFVLREFSWDRVASLMLSTYQDILRNSAHENENANLQSA